MRCGPLVFNTGGPVLVYLADGPEVAEGLRTKDTGRTLAAALALAPVLPWLRQGQLDRRAQRIVEKRAGLKEGALKTPEAQKAIAEKVATLTGRLRQLKEKAFYDPTVTGDPTLASGEGTTDKYGNARFSTQGSVEDLALAKAHEMVHRRFSPKFKLLREWRANLRLKGYEHVQLLRYLEEMLAETEAQIRVRGLRAAREGFSFPFREDYVQVKPVVTQAAIATVTLAGAVYGVYYLSSR
jgi:hypothetical protein